MRKVSSLIKIGKNCILLGFFVFGCNQESPNNVIPGTIIPQITTLSSNKEFVRTQNSWASNAGFSQISLFESYQRWLSLKNTEGSTYIYSKVFGSWTGHSLKYQILVVEDSIARIIRTDYQLDGNTGHCETLSQREIPTDSTLYFGILNIDNMYKFAQDSVLTKNTSTNTIFTEISENGILKSCKYRPNGCFDDCLFGVSIDSLFFGEIKSIR